MTTTGTIAPPDALSGQPHTARRAAPQPDGASAAQHFAELLQRRRDAQPEPPREPEARPQRRAEARSGSAPDHANRDAAAAGKDSGDATPEASVGSGPAEARTPAQGKPRDLPVDDVPLLPPALAAGAARDASAADGLPVDGDDDTQRDAAAPVLPGSDLPWWPGMAQPPIGMTPHADTAAAAIAAGAAPRTAAGRLAPAGLVAADAVSMLPGVAEGNPGAAGAAGQGAGDAQSGAQAGTRDDAQAGRAAALLAAGAANQAASSAEAVRIVHDARDAVASPWAAGGTAHRVDGGAPQAQVALATPLGAPDFARALGAQVSVFARNGLAHAELQLTPAEMGPIRVQIAIDGAHARVDFAADSPATRQVIERGLPELASALREQGLTLAGGGVFQRAPDQSKDNDAPQTERTAGRGRRRSNEAIAEPVRVRSVAVRPGGVDLYA